MNVLLKGMTIFLPREFNTIYTIKSELKDKTHQKYKELIKRILFLFIILGPPSRGTNGQFIHR
ncbi:hypothetical protein BANRA_03140 [Escherichia coli]|nr:hypothetical protein BANRA_03140 [Escherichia coli]